MMSSKQKREELQLKQRIKKMGLEKALLSDGLKRGTIIAVDKKKIVSRSAVPKIPDYYRDTCFICKNCGVEETWTAKQQQRWYEEQGGEIETKAVFCRACRRVEKMRREAARRIHFDGLAKKARQE